MKHYGSFQSDVPVGNLEMFGNCWSLQDGPYVLASMGIALEPHRWVQKLGIPFWEDAFCQDDTAHSIWPGIESRPIQIPFWTISSLELLSEDAGYIDDLPQ